MRSKELQGIALVEATHVGPRQRPTAIYLRSSFTTGDKGAANGIAQAWHNPNNRVSSCHYVVDEAQTLRCMPDNKTSYPIDKTPFRNAISINVCHDPPDRPSDKVLDDAAILVARLCALHKVKMRILEADSLDKWLKRRWRSNGGIIIQSFWGVPGEEFLDLVRFEYEVLDRKGL